MYLSKQWRESRIITILAALALALLLALVVKAGTALNAAHLGNGNNHGGGMLAVFVPIFYIESVLIGFWGWLAASVGAGKNLGEGSGSFLFTRPRSRAWFLWNDWGYAMGQIAIIIALTNLMFGLLAMHILHLMRHPAIIQLTDDGNSIPLFAVMLILSIGVLLFAGLVYGLTYFSTVITRRASGVLLGAGILVGYLVLGGLVHHYYHSVQFPSLMMNLFNLHHGFHGFAGNLSVNIIARAAVVVAFPVAAQLLLDRSEI